MPHLHHFRHYICFEKKKQFFFPTFNAYPQKQFQKTLTNRFREKFQNVYFGRKNYLFPTNLGIIRSFIKMH